MLGVVDCTGCQKSAAVRIAHTPSARPIRWRVALLLSVTCAVRIGETLGLRERDLDLERGQLHVHQTGAKVDDGIGHRRIVLQDPKTRSAQRTVHLLPHTLDELRTRHAKEPKRRLDDLIFGDEYGRPVNDERPLDVPGPARRLADQLGNIVRAATAGDAGTTWESALPCPRMPGHRRCTGRMLIRRDFEPSAPIRWQCSVCSDEGSISNWASSPFDLRPQRLTRVDPVCEVGISFEVAAALRELQLLGSDCERPVFRIRPRDAGALLLATEDALEELIGAVAAEANHEVGRRRQQRLDAAFEALSAAGQSVGGR